MANDPAPERATGEGDRKDRVGLDSDEPVNAVGTSLEICFGEHAVQF